MTFNLASAAVALFAISISTAHASSKLFNVLRDGKWTVQRESTVSFEGCEHDKAYVVGEFIFVCQEYGYSYSYGDVLLITNGTTIYMCTDDDECYEGQLYNR